MKQAIIKAIIESSSHFLSENQIKHLETDLGMN